MRSGIKGVRSGVPAGLTASTGVTVSANNQVIENLFIQSSGTAITVGSYSGVIIRNCLIRYNCAGNSGTARGISGLNSTTLTIEDCEIINAGAPLIGALPSTSQNCIYLESCATPTISRVTTRQGSTGISLVSCSNTTVTYHENHDARGPYPRGQAIQWNTCTGTHTVTNVSDESIPGTSWNEDSYNVYATPNVTINGIYIPMQSDGLSGRGLVLEGLLTTNCAVLNMEALYTFNGLAGGFEVNGGNDIQANAKYYNRYSVRALPGSSNSGNTLCALAVTFYNPTPGEYTDMDVLFYGIPARAPDGTAYNSGKLNSWYNPPDTGGIPQGTGTVTEQDWTITRSAVRNAFSWRFTAGAPLPDLQPRIGSYWLDGRIATSLVAGTSILGLLPGRYKNDPTTRSFQWRKNGTNISGATGIDYDILVGDSGSLIDCVETVSNANGSLVWTTASVAIP